MPILSLILFTPLAGALMLALTPRDNEGAIRRSAFIFSLMPFAFSLILLACVRSEQAGMQFIERAAWIPAFQIEYSLGVDGMSLFLVLLTTFLTPLVILAGWGDVHKRVKEYMIFMLLLETGMLGALSRPRPLPVLRLLGGHADPDVLPHRGLGRPAAHLRGDQVRALHHGRQPAHAGRHPLPGAAIRRAAGSAELRHPAPLQPDAAVPHAGWLFAAFALAFAIKVPMFPLHTWLPDAHVEAPTGGSVILAGRSAEAGHLRLPALRHPALPAGGRRAAAPLHRLSGGDRHRLRRAGGDGAAGPEEAGRLLVGEPPRLRHARALRPQRSGDVRRRLPDAQPRPLDRRAVPPRRRDLRAAPHAPDRRVRRPVEAAAGLCRLLPDRHAVVGRPAGAERLRRRVPHPARRLFHPPALAIIGTTGVVLGAVYMLWMFQRVMFGPITKRREQDADRSLGPRDRGAGADHRHVLVHGPLPAAVPPPHAAFRRRLRRPHAREAGGGGAAPLRGAGAR